MPLYLLRGFRWPRRQIRIFVILGNLEEATADYIQYPITSHAIRDEIFRQHPHLKEKLPHLMFIEQYDPNDLMTGAQPWAFVADIVSVPDPAGPNGQKKGKEKDGEEATHVLSYDILKGIAEVGGLVGEATEAMVELKDALAAGVGDKAIDDGVGWWTVWNGDEARGLEVSDEEEEAGEEGEGEEAREGKSKGDVDAKSTGSNDSVVTQTPTSTVNGVAVPKTASSTTAAPLGSATTSTTGGAGGAQYGSHSSKRNAGRDDKNASTGAGESFKRIFLRELSSKEMNQTL